MTKLTKNFQLIQLFQRFGGTAVATLFIYFVFFKTCIPNHIHTMIKYSHLSPFAEASLHFLFALVLSEDKPPWGTELRFELGPAFEQASAPPTELHCTLHFFTE
jgi:hypothetical protein